MRPTVRVCAGVLTALGAAAAIGTGYWLTTAGKCHLDTGWGRRMRPLGPLHISIAAPARTVFEVITGSYLGPAAVTHHTVRVLAGRGDTVVAEYRTPVHGGRRTALTLHAVTLEGPDRIRFQLLRGPVPHAVQQLSLAEYHGVTTVVYNAELGTDFGALGSRWANLVATVWENTVRLGLAQIRADAEHLTTPPSEAADTPSG